MLGNLSRAKKLKNGIVYYLGYSNFTFELWIVLHKADCFRMLENRTQYLVPINRAFDEHFSDLRHYKHEDNFARILNKLSLDDVFDAIRRAKRIQTFKKENNIKPIEQFGYSYYRDAPSSDLWMTIEKIMKDCELL